MMMLINGRRMIKTDELNVSRTRARATWLAFPLAKQQICHSPLWRSNLNLNYVLLAGVRLADWPAFALVEHHRTLSLSQFPPAKWEEFLSAV